jgi:hypothetical protein
MQDSKKLKERIIAAGRIAVEELIKVAQEDILKPGDDDLAADRLKNAAATKKLAIFDALEILSRIDSEEEALGLSETKTVADSKMGFAERRSR